MGILAHTAARYAEGPGNLAHIQITTRIHAQGVRGDKISGRFAVGAAPVRKQVTRNIKGARIYRHRPSVSMLADSRDK